MSWMTSSATLKMTERQLTRGHSVRTVTHINTLPRSDLNVGDFPSDSRVSLQTIQICAPSTQSLSSICPFTRSRHPLCPFVPRCNTRRHQQEWSRLPSERTCRRIQCGRKSSLGASTGQKDENRTVRLNAKYRGFKLLSAAYWTVNFPSTSFGSPFTFEMHICWVMLRESKRAPSNDASFIAENKVSSGLTAQTKI